MNPNGPMPTQAENPDGLHQRYIVTKADGEPINPHAIYFVLQIGIGDDAEHIAACRYAALAYANYVQLSAPHLAKIGSELRDLVRKLVAIEGRVDDFVRAAGGVPPKAVSPFLPNISNQETASAINEESAGQSGNPNPDNPQVNAGDRPGVPNGVGGSYWCD